MQLKKKKQRTKNITMSNKKLKRLIFLIAVIVTIYSIVYFVPKNYEFKYKIDKYHITEKYIKTQKMYSFKIKNKDKVYEIISTMKYNPKRKLIKKIEEYNKEDISCIIIDSKMIDYKISCLKNNESVDYRLLDINLPKKYYKEYQIENISYNDINLNLFEDKSYYVWNYTGFYKINKNEKEKINLFKNDIYNINLNVVMDKYLVVADYDQKYNFNKFKIVNLKNNKIEEIVFDYEISFDSEIIGTHKNSFYLIDKKNKKEYEINIKKKKVEIISKNEMGKVLKYDNWENIKLNKIITDNIKFENYTYYVPKIKDGLYLYQLNYDNPIKISNKKVKNIIKYSNDEIYFIVDDKLYKYDFEYGEREVLTYFELNFNYDNMIFVY